MSEKNNSKDTDNIHNGLKLPLNPSTINQIASIRKNQLKLNQIVSDKINLINLKMNYKLNPSTVDMVAYLTRLESEWKNKLAKLIEQSHEIQRLNLRTIEETIQINSILDFRKMIKRYSESNDHYYRGQENCIWSLSSSIERFPLSTNMISEGKINTGFLNVIYGKANISALNYKGLYETLAYFQHYHSYSPLIDFSSDITHALCFALQNCNKLYDKKQNFSLYVIKCDKNKVLTEYDEIEEKIKESKIILINNYKDGSKKTRVNEYSIISLEQNDRMKFQKAVFLLNKENLLFSDELEEDDYKKLLIESSQYHFSDDSSGYGIKKIIISYKLIPKIMFEYLNAEKYKDLLDPANYVDNSKFLVYSNNK